MKLNSDIRLCIEIIYLLKKLHIISIVDYNYDNITMFYHINDVKFNTSSLFFDTVTEEVGLTEIDPIQFIKILNSEESELISDDGTCYNANDFINHHSELWHRCRNCGLYNKKINV